MAKKKVAVEVKTQRTNKEVKDAIVKVMEKRGEVKTPIETKIEIKDKIEEIKFIIDEIKPAFDIKSEMDLLNEKIDRVVVALEKQNNQTKLSDMSLSDLNYLKEMLNRNITMNNYAGGDMDLKVKSNALIVKIMDEINNRINLYE